MERDVKIPYNLETTPIVIKTNSAAGSKEAVRVLLYTAGGADAGRVYFNFDSPPGYRIGSCTPYTRLTSSLPSEVNKVWKIIKLPGPRITLQCNEVTVVDILLSDDTCSDSHWSTYWSKQVKQIYFDSVWDTASDEYRDIQPGKPLTLFYIACLLSHYYHTVG